MKIPDMKAEERRMVVLLLLQSFNLYKVGDTKVGHVSDRGVLNFYLKSCKLLIVIARGT